jgi:predicted AlkP superfamily phosphohydrolase/phosphomutase
MIEMGPDRMHHGFWRDFDPAHRLHVPGGPHARAIPDYYTALDDHVCRLVAAAGEDTAVLIVSDHGARAMQGAFAVNRWLIEQGDLILKETPDAPAALDPAAIDWDKTWAWADGGYHARVWLNLAGREPGGCLPEDQRQDYLASLAARLEDTRDESDRPLGTRVIRPERTYRRLQGIPPDLLVYFGDLGWRASAVVGPGPVHLRENDTGPDDANHARDGIFVFLDPAPGRGDRLACRKILDIAPAVLDWFGHEGSEDPN